MTTSIPFSTRTFNDDISTILNSVPILLVAQMVGIRAKGIYRAMSKGTSISEILGEDIARILYNRLDPNPVIMGFVYMEDCHYCKEFRPIWNNLKNKFSHVVVFEEINRDTQTNDIKLFNENLFNKRVFGDNNLDENKIESYPTIFYTEDHKIKYYDITKPENDRSKESLEKLLDELIEKNENDPNLQLYGHDINSGGSINAKPLNNNRTRRSKYNQTRRSKHKYGVELVYDNKPL